MSQSSGRVSFEMLSVGINANFNSDAKLATENTGFPQFSQEPLCRGEIED